MDITTFHGGFHGDLNETFFVGEVSDSAKKLVKTTHECLSQAISEGISILSVKQTIEICLSNSMLGMSRKYVTVYHSECN